MAKGHGLIISLGSGLPFVFTFNPPEVSLGKKINYFNAPNVGGSHREQFFTGFENGKAAFTLTCIDMEDPLGVTEEIAFFEALRSPDTGILGLGGSLFGNENYPPPQVLFNFGTGQLLPLVWNVDNVDIKTSLMMAGTIRGVLGIPKRADINITLSLDEENILNKANMIAKRAAMIAGSVESLLKEATSRSKGGRREQIGIWPVVSEDF